MLFLNMVCLTVALALYSLWVAVLLPDYQPMSKATHRVTIGCKLTVRFKSQLNVAFQLEANVCFPVNRPHREQPPTGH
jgi:hypothetical protein